MKNHVVNLTHFIIIINRYLSQDHHQTWLGIVFRTQKHRCAPPNKLLAANFFHSFLNRRSVKFHIRVTHHFLTSERKTRRYRYPCNGFAAAAGCYNIIIYMGF